MPPGSTLTLSPDEVEEAPTLSTDEVEEPTKQNSSALFSQVTRPRAPAPIPPTSAKPFDLQNTLPPPKGLVKPGNINLNNRPILQNADGTHSTELSFSRGTDEGEVLVPQVVNGKKLSQDEAWKHYQKTGEHMGVFDTPDNADAYARDVHNRRQSTSLSPQTRLGKEGPIETPPSTPAGLVTEQQERRGGMPLTIQPPSGSLEAPHPEQVAAVPRPITTLAQPMQPAVDVREPGPAALPLSRFTTPPVTPQQAQADIEGPLGIKSLSGYRGYGQLAKGVEEVYGPGNEPGQVTRGATDILKGATTAATPLMIATAITQPELTALALGGATAGGAGARKIAELVKASPETQDLAEQAGQIAGGFAGGGAFEGLKHLTDPTNALSDLLWKRGYIQDNNGHPIYITSQAEARVVAQEILKQNPMGIVESAVRGRQFRQAAENVNARETGEFGKPPEQLPANVPVVQPEEVEEAHHTSNDTEELRASAERQAEKIGDTVKAATESVPGAKLEAVRDSKDTDRIEDKAERQNIQPSQVGDIAAAKVTVPDQAAADKVLENLPVVSKEGTVTGEPQNNAVRQTQAHIDTGAPAHEPVKRAEVLVQTPEMHAATDKSHDDYRKAQELRAQGKVAEAEKLEKEIAKQHEAAEQTARTRQEAQGAVQKPSAAGIHGSAQEETRAAGSQLGRVGEVNRLQQPSAPSAQTPGQEKEKAGISPAGANGQSAIRAPKPPGQESLKGQQVQVRTESGEWKDATVLADNVMPSGSGPIRRLRGTFSDGSKFNNVKVQDVRKPEAGRLGIDFDGTLFTENSDGLIGKPIPERIASLKQDLAAGKNVEIESHRARLPGGAKAIQDALESVGLPRLRVTAKKTDTPELVGDKEKPEPGVKVDEVATNANTPLPGTYGPAKADFGGKVPLENLGFNPEPAKDYGATTRADVERRMGGALPRGTVERRVSETKTETTPAIVAKEPEKAAPQVAPANQSRGGIAQTGPGSKEYDDLKKRVTELEARKPGQAPIPPTKKTQFEPQGGKEQAARDMERIGQAGAEAIVKHRVAEGKSLNAHEQQIAKDLGIAPEPTTAETERQKLGHPPEPGRVGEMRTSAVTVAPHKFQYKLSTDAEGVGTLLKDTRVYNPDLAGVISVWRDPTDGKTYVINGHHRYELAKRTGQPSVTVRHIIAANAVRARAIGALQNIAEGRGTAIDAAKFFHDSGLTPEDLKSEGISLGEKTASDGLAMSRLDPSILAKVINGDIRQGMAVAIGEGTADPAEQKAILSLVERKERAGKKLSDDTLSELIRLVKGSEQTTETTANLFGTQEINRSLAIEKAEVSAHIKQQLAKDKKLFGFVSKGDRATELERGGNKIDVEKSKEISTGAAQAEEVYNLLSARGGPIASILDEAARKLADGESAQTVKQDAYARIRAEVSKTLGGGQAGSAGRPEGASESPTDTGISLFSPETELAPPFYSKAARVAFDKLPMSGSGDSMLATLRNAGVKEDEIKWIGLDDFLKDKPKATKQEVLSYIMRNMVQVREVNKGTGNTERLDELNDRRESIIADLTYNQGYGVDQRGDHYDVALTDHAGNELWVKYGSEQYDALPQPLRDTLDALSTIDRQMRLEHQRNQNKTKYDSYTLPGDKKNYTELLLTLPQKKGTPPPLLDELPEGYEIGTDSSKRDTGGLYHVLPPGQIHARPFAGSHPTEKQAHDAALKVLNSNRYYQWEAENERNKFTTSHFEEPNIVAHVRFDERIDADGKPILFVEEVQSDWHQKGKKVGYRDSGPGANYELARGKAEAAWQDLKPLLAKADNLGYDHIAALRSDIANGDLSSDNVHTEAADLRNAMDRYHDTFQAMVKANNASRDGVPNAPFKSDWHELAMKTMLRKAAEGGYDKIGWVTGEQTADRYDLSKRVDTIRYDTELGMLYAIRDDATVLAKRVKPGEISDYIGKEPADRLLKADTDENGVKRLANADLRIGATWATNLYDRAIPNFLSKYGKKWGAKVEDSEIQTGHNKWNDREYSGPVGPTTEKELRDLAQGKDSPSAAVTMAAKEVIKGIDSGHSLPHAMRYFGNDVLAEAIGGKLSLPRAETDTIHSLTVTPEMRASVLSEGQPLFSSSSSPINATSAKDIQFQMKPTRPDLPPYLLLNPDAVQAINRVLGVRLNGVNIDIKMMPEIVTKLKAEADNLESEDHGVAAMRIRALANAMMDNVDPVTGLSVVKQNENIGEQLATLHEEHLHAMQRAAGGGDLREGVPWREMLKEPGMAQMAANRITPQLIKSGIAPHPSVIAAEGLVDIMRGDAWEITDEQAEQTAQKFFEATAAQHGIESVQKFQDVEDFIAQEAARLGVNYGRQSVREAGRTALARVLSEATGRGLQRAGEGKASQPQEIARGGAAALSASANAGERPLGPRTANEGGALTSTQAIGLTDDELAEWSKAKGFRVEPAGEQLDIFGANEPVMRVFRSGPRGQEQKGLVYQRQLDQLSKPKEQPAEPFALTGGESREEQPALFGAGDLGEIVGNPKAESGIKLPSRDRGTSLFKPEKESLLTGESGSFTPSTLSPSNVRKSYDDLIEKFISGTLKIGDKYYEVAKHDPTVAHALHLIDNKPMDIKRHAEANLKKVLDGLNDDQIRLAALMVDSDSRDDLKLNHPQEFQQAQNDPAVMAAVKKFEPLQKELAKDRQALGWPVRMSMEALEQPDGTFKVFDRQGNDQGDFKTAAKAAKFIKDNADLEPHLKRTYPEHTKSPLPAETGAGDFTGSFPHEKGLRPPKMDRKAREMSAQYHYEHGRKDFSGYAESYKQVKQAIAKQELFNDFTKNATPWKNGTAMPPTIEYNGKKYTRPDLVKKAKEGGTKLDSYEIYDPSRGERFFMFNPEEGWGTQTTGKPGIGPNDRFLGPKQVVDAMENYDVTRGGESGKLRHFFQEQIVGLFGPMVHVNNILRHVGHATGLGTFDPRSWPSIARIIASPELRRRVLNGVDDATIALLSREGAWVDWGDIGTLNKYIGGNLNPATWIRAFGKGVLFDPKFAGGWGGLDPKARLVIADYFKAHYPKMTDQQVASAVNDGLGNYNRANWTERQRLLAKFTLFPGWDTASAKWFLRHPFKVGIAGSLVFLAINQALRALGQNKGDDSTDLSYIHIGDRKISSGLISDNMGNHMMAPVLGALQAKIRGEDAGTGATEGAMKGSSALAGTLAGPVVEMIADEVYNKKYAGGATELVKPDDKYTPGTWAPNVELEKRIAFAALKGSPALNRFIDNKGEWDWAQGLGGAVLGITNYKYGAEERFKANLGKAAAYGQTLNQLAEHDPKAAADFVKDPLKATYLMFHDDMESMGRDLKEINSQIERVRGADLSATEREQALKDLKDNRNEILKAADGLNDALDEQKAQARKNEANFWSAAVQ